MKLYQRCFSLVMAAALLASPCQAGRAAQVELSLADSITLAITNNYDIKYAQAAKEKSYWVLQEAKKNKGVSLDYTHTDQRYNTPPSVTFSEYLYTTNFDNQLALNLPVYSGGKLEGQIEQAKLDLQVAEMEVEAARQQLKLTAVTDYFTVLEYRNEVQVNQETVKNYTEHLSLVQAKYDAGLVDKSDVLASQVDLAQARNSLLKAQNNYTNAAATLNNDLGLPHTTEVVLKDDFTYEQFSGSLEECLAYAAGNRPEIAQYEAKVASARQEVKIAKSGNLPTVDLTAEQDWYDSRLPGSKNSNWLVKLTTSFNVFDSGVTKSKIEQAQHNVAMVRDKAAQQRDGILLAVRQCYLNMTEAEQRIDTNKVSVVQAEENLMIQKARYEVGVSTNLDLRDAVLSLDSARKDYIQAVYDYHTSKAQLEQAMGMPVE